LSFGFSFLLSRAAGKLEVLILENLSFNSGLTFDSARCGRFGDFTFSDPFALGVHLLLSKSHKNPLLDMGDQFRSKFSPDVLHEN
jgi:hypothetical protein